MKKFYCCSSLIRSMNPVSQVKKATVLFLCFCAAATQVAAAEWYVCGQSGKNRNAGNTATAPFKNIQKALDSAAPGDTVKVAQGNYFGTMNSGNIKMTKPVILMGGYSPDFATRDVLKYPTLIQPDNKSNGTGSEHPLLRLDFKSGTAVVDGLIFDKGESNNYHVRDGVVEGVERGMLLHPPQRENQSTNPNAKQPLIGGPSSGGLGDDLTIRNCVFVNGNNVAIRIPVTKGNVKILNNVFAANVMAAAELWGANQATPPLLEFAWNTVLFTWSRTKDLGDMGYGVRAMTMMNYNIHHNIIGFSCFAGVDATRDDKNRKLSIDNNIFLLNRLADLTLPGGGMFLRVWVKDFEDLEIESSEDNTALQELGPLAGAINKAYAAGFLNVSYKETVDFDENSPANAFRAAMGLNKQGKISSTVSMYANKYPLKDALLLFGAYNQAGAQTPQ